MTEIISAAIVVPLALILAGLGCYLAWMRVVGKQEDEIWAPPGARRHVVAGEPPAFVEAPEIVVRSSFFSRFKKKS